MATFTDDPTRPKFAITQAVRYTGAVGLDEFDHDLAANEVHRFVDNVEWFEKLGYDMATITEHHFGMFGSLSPAPHLALAAAAVRTSKIRLATAVTVLPFRSPLIVAEEAILLDNLSRGRFELGLGRGASPIETLPFGISMDEVGRRWNEGLEIVDLALTQTEFTHESSLPYGNVPVPTTVFPPSYQRLLPIWIGAVSPNSAVTAGSRGYNLMRNLGDAATHAKVISGYVQAAQENGHNLTGANVMIERFVSCSESADEAAETLGEFFTVAGKYADKLRKQFELGEDIPMSSTEAELAAATAGRLAIGGPPDLDLTSMFVTGTPKTLADSIEELMVETGCNRILFAIDDRDRKTVELIASQVLPRLRKVDVQVQGM
ncbi:LLM class flavin-dependent oxidoreductase [Streptomyces griseorubiginosus]|uniref:LLM class flavin-dependent oxidoreductase n=1 Tax=Streptomyces griseorubiginosus TaxID=67304 RepID=UPI001AD6DB78|nr:LLM class flavin-dependent oxidoreductase [Streptomyces griseorubiginosus]MBO4256204.1 LLM class flavin-dependent oxidoreductase [Streptomyces griseorubiginosus]